MKKGEIAHNDSGGKGGKYAVFKRKLSPVAPPCANILGDKCRKGLHIGRADKHQKAAYLFGNANACALRKAKRVYYREYDEEGQADKQLLQRDRRAELENA